MTTRTVPFDLRNAVQDAVSVVEVPVEKQILGPTGKPARRSKTANCVNCGASAEHMVSAGGFGLPGKVCDVCGSEPKE